MRVPGSLFVNPHTAASTDLLTRLFMINTEFIVPVVTDIIIHTCVTLIFQKGWAELYIYVYLHCTVVNRRIFKRF